MRGIMNINKQLALNLIFVFMNISAVKYKDIGRNIIPMYEK